ncbi:MAG: hypothetical protein J5850_06565, partial [Clostridia bacterium]|nr:hypothetical protein [Clostridia bacterium]
MRKSNILFFIILLVLIAVFIVYLVLQSNKSKDKVPVINIADDNIVVKASATYEDLMQGVTAYDEEDGDVTASIIIESISQFDTRDMSREVTYVAFDSANHVVSSKRTIRYSNYVGPTFILTEALNFTSWDEKKVLSMIRAVDMLDGDISDNISVLSSTLVDSQYGVYEFNVSVTNSAGDTSSAVLYLTTARNAKRVPKIVLSDYLIYVSKDSAFDPMIYFLDGESNSGIEDEPVSVTCETDVDTSTPGCYLVTYVSSNSAGFETYAYMTV